MKKIPLLIMLAAIGLFASRTLAQSISVTPTITEADIINATSLVDPLAEKVKDIAPTTFSLTILNLTSPRVPVMVNMLIKAYVTLDEDRKYSKIVEAHTTKPFTIPEQGRLFTSKDAQDNPKSDIDIKADIDPDIKKKLKDKISDPASGGRVPSGTYEVHIEVTVVKVGNRDTSEAPIVIDRTVQVTNPTTAILNMPSENGFQYPTPFPQFQFIYDVSTVVISVYEKRPEHQSLEDAISASDPFLKIKISKRESGNMSTYTYPQSAVSTPGVSILKGPRPLEQGKVYVIVLDGLASAFGFEVDPLRTIRSFSIADPQGQMLVNLLQTTFSGTPFENAINAIQNQNLHINSSRLSLNGIPITVQELQVILSQNKSKVTSIRFED